MKIFSLTFKKISVLFGGRPLLLPAAAAALALCLAVISGICSAGKSDSVRITIVNESGGELSNELVAQLKETPGLYINMSESIGEAENEVSRGSSEALLHILDGYDEHVADEKISGLIRLVTAPGSVSSEYIRETVSGKILAKRAEVRVLKGLEDEGYDISEFDSYMEELNAPQIYRIESFGGGVSAEKAVFGKGFAGYEGFAALAVMLIMLTVSRQFAERSSKLVTERLRSIRCGIGLAFGSDLLALFLPAVFFSLIAFALAPERSPRLILGLCAYSLMITGLCLLLSNAGGGGRIDVASPFIALATSILGGCFADLGSLSPALSAISKYTPQGQLIAFVHGADLFAVILAAEGLLLCVLAFLLQKKKA